MFALNKELSPNLYVFNLYQTRHLSLSSTLQELSLCDSEIDFSCLGQEVVKLFKNDPLLPGVIITEQGELLGMLSRQRFLEHLSRPYGRELFLRRAIKCLYLLASAEVLTLSEETLIVAAVKKSLQRPTSLIYEPIVVEIEPKVYRLLDIHQLLVAHSSILFLTSQLLNRQTIIQKQILEQLQQEITERNRAELALEQANEDLENRVEERTAQLKDSEQRFRFLAEMIPRSVLL